MNDDSKELNFDGIEDIEKIAETVLNINKSLHLFQ
jgi:hypothetical protein